uniref:Uncharacterized protein n=1 Tax=Rhizophora mucronata TaxID=61149 RepID=A0A2P2MXQ6_RHIMU
MLGGLTSLFVAWIWGLNSWTLSLLNCL